MTEIAGYYGHLKAGFDALGIDAVFVDFSPNPFRYPQASPPNLLVRAATDLGRRRSRAPRTSWLRKAWWKGLHLLSLVALFLWAVLRHDLFVFGFGTSFFGLRELPLLKRLGKRLVFVFNGSDSRPPYIDGAIMAADRGTTIAECIALTRRQKRKLATIERSADAIVAHGPHGHFFTRPLASFLVVGVPYAVEPAATAEPARPDGAPVRILHSPSHPEAKGTPDIREAVAAVRAEGVPVELVELTGQPNAVVLEELRRCDFVIDQLYSDNPMVGFATEAASFGRPAIVGGYAWPEVRRMTPVDRIPPVELCHPDELQAAIRKLTLDAAYRAELGRRAREFVAANWAPAAVAERYLRLVADEAPPEWMIDPREIRYAEGVGMSAPRARELIRAVVTAGGVEALQLSDKPELERLMLEFAGVAAPGAGRLSEPAPARPA